MGRAKDKNDLLRGTSSNYSSFNPFTILNDAPIEHLSCFRSRYFL
jgi:hypothetical protein